MLGMMTNKGGRNTSMPMGSNPKIAAMFNQNRATAPAAGPTTLPTITQPQRPQIGMPPAPAQRPVAQTSGPPQISPWSMVNIGGQMKPAAMTSLVQQMGRPSGGPSPEELKAFHNFRKQQIRDR